MQSNDPPARGLAGWLQQTDRFSFSVYCIAAAFTTYFCMYAFRKPFTAGEFTDVSLWGIGYKTVLIASQVAGYTISKFVGIKVISEMPAARRAVALLLLIGVAEFALLLFAIVPAPYNFPLLFLNGLPLGMVFGLVLSFLEGRRVTEALSAGLCASFILSSGVVKSVGRELVIDYNISEYWMPFLTGLIFLVPLAFGVFLLSQIPKPSLKDVQQRSERQPMDHAQRKAFFGRHALGLTGLLFVFILLTIVRGIRDDFAVEIWGDLGISNDAYIFTKSEFPVMIGVLGISSCAIWIRSNRGAFLGSLALILGGFLLVLYALWAQQTGRLSPFYFMVLIGLGMYVPYVVYHTTVFERLLAAFRENGNLGYLMYLADATGYLGYVVVMSTKGFWPSDLNFLNLFINTTLGISIAATAVTLMLIVHYHRTLPYPSAVEATPVPASETP